MIAANMARLDARALQDGQPSRNVPSPQRIRDISQSDRISSRGSLLGKLLPRHLMARTDCSKNQDSNLCEKPTGSVSLTIPITIVAVVVVVIALGVLFYLHRRGKKRQQLEDNNDKYKSLDFGLNDGKGGKRKSMFGLGEKSKGTIHGKGLSMDMNLSSPYLLPNDAQSSRSSFNSIARTLHNNEDPYRPVAQLAQNDGKLSAKGSESTSRSSTLTSNHPTRQGSLPPSPLAIARSPSSAEKEDSVSRPAPLVTPSKAEFQFHNDSTTVPVIGAGFTDQSTSAAAAPMIQPPAPIAHKEMPSSPRPSSQLFGNEDMTAIGGLVRDRDSSALPASDMHNTVNGLSIVVPDRKQDGIVPSSLTPGRPSPHGEFSTPPLTQGDASSFQFNLEDEVGTSQRGRPTEAVPQRAGLGVPNQDNKRLSVGLRPLPPDEYLDSDDPEHRANRIRSFYKEYFDDSKEQRPPLPKAQHAEYFEDYGAEFSGDAAYFDPETNAFIMPYAQPVTRRAMTPPPSGRKPMPSRPRPRGPGGPGPRMGEPRPRAGSAMSNGFGPGSPRPSSSASARMHGKPKKNLPPPSALNTLPTPSKLKDDAFSVFSTVDFAPPPTFKDQAAGRSQSPHGERKPYNTPGPASSPLVSAFDDMAALPSPHLLRKSGLYTGLDFAPPKRFKDPDSMSDAGSVRSLGSGISARNLGALRNGAGRISRLPGDQIFTAEATPDTLKPKWGMRDY